MIPISAEHATVLQSQHEVEYRVQAFRGPNVTVVSVPVTSDGSLSFSADAVVQCKGSVFLAKADSVSLVPKSKADPLAPFGQELSIVRVDKAGAREWLTPMGQLRIVGVPSMREFFRRFPSQVNVVGWSAQLELADRFEQIDADEFLYPDAPKVGNSSWQEIQRLSPIPIVRPDVLPDRAVPAGLAYPESRMEAITLLLANLGGYPALTRAGALTGRVRDNWLTATVPVFTVDGVIDMDDSLSNKLFNAVRLKSSAGDNSLVSVREITDRSNPANVTDMGRRTFKVDSPLHTTQASLDAAAVSTLARMSKRQSRAVRVTCLPQPHLELGDFIAVIDRLSGREVWGEVTAMLFSFDPTAPMSLELIAAEIR